MNFTEQLGRFYILPLSYYHDLFGFVQIQIQRAKHMGETEGLVFHDIVIRTENFLRSLQVILFSRQVIEAQ